MTIGGKGLIALYLVCGSLGCLVYVVGQAIHAAGGYLVLVSIPHTRQAFLWAVALA